MNSNRNAAREQWMKMLFYFSLETIGAEIYVQNNIIYLKLNICVQVQDFLTSHPSEDRTKKLYTSLTNFLLKRLKNEQQPVDATLSKPAGPNPSPRNIQSKCKCMFSFGN